MGTRASAEPAQTEHDSDLRELSDPEFFARWAQVRLRYAVTSQGSPEYSAAKAAYDVVLAEYRRQLTPCRPKEVAHMISLAAPAKQAAA